MFLNNNSSARRGLMLDISHQPVPTIETLHGKLMLSEVLNYNELPLYTGAHLRLR